MGQIERVRHVRAWDDPAVVEQRGGFQRVGDAPGDEGNPFEPVGPLRFDPADVAVDRSFARAHHIEHGRAPEQQGQAEQPGGQMGQGPDHVAGRSLVEHGGERVPLADQVAGHKVKQRAAAREHDRGFREHARRLEQNVRASGVHDAGKRPAPEGDGAFHRAHGDDDVFGPQVEGFPAP